jgi:hypothetical protein
MKGNYMDKYEENAYKELIKWKKEVSKNPNVIEKVSKNMQRKVNNIIPEKFHEIVTNSIKNLVKGVIVGSDYITKRNLFDKSLKESELKINEKLKLYKNSATIEGIVTGSGGIFLGLADFPLLLSIKFKFLFDCANLYGFDTSDYKERLYILSVFQLSFSSREKMKEIYSRMLNWDDYVKTLPDNIEDFDWRSFQQEYRDYLDIAKLFQLIPGIGAVVGGYVNYKLLNKLSYIAKNSYRLRLLKEG